MDRTNDIGRYLHANLAPDCRRGSVSDDRVNELLEDLAPQALEVWPFDFSADGYTTTYQKLETGYNQGEDFAGDISTLIAGQKRLTIAAEIANQDQKMFFRASLSMCDEQVTVKLENLYRLEGNSRSNFGNLMIKNFTRFIEAQDQSRPKREAKSLPSELLVSATSNSDKSNIASCGGYVWAIQGFDFADNQELEAVRQHFKSFAASHKVEMTDIALACFTKPCHFAFFDCGIRVEDKYGLPATLGKAFMLIHENWNGRLTPPREQKEERCFAAVYNDRSDTDYRKKAFQKLNPAYRRICRFYQKRYAPRNKEKTSVVQNLSRICQRAVSLCRF